MRQIKTDSDVVHVARQIDAHLDIIRGLIYALKDSEHPNKKAIVESLDQNNLTAFAWATHCVSHELLHPERWDTGIFGIRYKHHEAQQEVQS